MTKDLLRQNCKIQRQTLSASYKKEAEILIQKELDSLLEKNPPTSSLLSYSALKEEVNLNSLHKKYCLKRSLFLPKVVGENLFFYKTLPNSGLLEHPQFKILEPLADDSNLYSSKNSSEDIILIPGLAFDKKGNRLGFGKGYFDRFLKNFQGLKIGITLQEFILKEIPTDAWDIQMDIIISEEKTLFLKPVSL